MIVLVGKTASGKSTVADILEKEYYIPRIRTYTTRPPREGESNEYHFISVEEFERLKGEDFFFETTSYLVASGDTWYYGTSKQEITNDSCIVMNPDGVKKLKHMIDTDYIDLKIIYLNTTEGMQWQRLRQRGDNSDEANRRIAADTQDFAHIDEYYDLAITTDKINPQDVAYLIKEFIS